MKNSRLFALVLVLCACGSLQAQRTYSNPILAGFYPDPSICRVDSDYYLINSTFSSGHRTIRMTDHWAEVVADFFSIFESRFVGVPLAGQKVILRKLIDKIIIDRERNVALAYIWRLSKREVRGVDDLLAQKKKGGQIPDLLLAVPPTGFEPVYWA